jgi:hypothetical protein
MVGFVDYQHVERWHLGEGVVSAECLDHGEGAGSEHLFISVTNDGLSASYVNEGRQVLVDEFVSVLDDQHGAVMVGTDSRQHDSLASPSRGDGNRVAMFLEGFAYPFDQLLLARSKNHLKRGCLEAEASQKKHTSLGCL